MFKAPPIARGPATLDLLAAAADVARAEAAAATRGAAGVEGLRPEDTRLQFTVRAVAALANLRALSLPSGADGAGGADGGDPAGDVETTRITFGARVEIFRAAVAVEKAFPPGPGDSPMALGLSEALRAYYEDGDSEGLFGARRWPMTLDTFFDSPTHVIVISSRGMFVLHEARVAAVYGLVDAALALVNRELSLSPERRAQLERRFRHWSSTALPLLTDATANVASAASAANAANAAAEEQRAAARGAVTEPAPAAASTEVSTSTWAEIKASAEPPVSHNMAAAAAAVDMPVPAEPSPTSPEGPVARRASVRAAAIETLAAVDAKVDADNIAVSSSDVLAQGAVTSATSADRKEDSHGSEEDRGEDAGSEEVPEVTEVAEDAEDAEGAEDRAAGGSAG